MRPVVRANTIKYNRKVRAGRGFTKEELKAAGIAFNEARSIGIAADARRQNKSVEGFEVNVNRLKDYKKRLIVLPRNPEKAKAVEAEFKATAQVSNAAAFPIVQDAVESGLRAVSTSSDSAFLTLRKARSDAKFAGMREKKARDAAAAEAEKKK